MSRTKVYALLILFSTSCASSNDHEMLQKTQQDILAELKEVRAALAEIQKKVAGETAPPATPEKKVDDALPAQDLGAAAEVPRSPAVVAPVPAVESTPASEPAKVEAEKPKETNDIAAADPIPAEETNQNKVSKTYWVKVGLLNVREGPATEYRVVKILKKGEQVTAAASEGNWIMLADKQYVSLNYLTDVAP